MPQRSGSSPCFTAAARITASTERPWRRNWSVLVYSQSSSQAWLRSIGPHPPFLLLPILGEGGDPTCSVPISVRLTRRPLVPDPPDRPSLIVQRVGEGRG